VSAFAAAMAAAFGPDRLRSEVPLAPFTTFRVGGPAEWFFESRGSQEIVAALRIAHDAGIPVTPLGGGSNVLVADRGVRGLVVRTRGGEVVRIDDTRIRADAAVTINGLVRWTLNHGCAGLEAWAGTPGTVGGAVFGNAHFGGRLIGELIEAVRLASRAGVTSDVPVEAMAFGYDRSRLQHTGEVLLSAVFRVSRGEPAALRSVARASLAFRKRTQPLETPSAGCIFQNPGGQSAGALVSPAHGNFIVNEGSATASDIRALIDRCRAAVRERFGIELREEIVYMGEFART
jgi:UDP-N-acetylmuramate dehydrogenase